MRTGLVFLVLAALFLAPGAIALAPITVEAPGQDATVEGQTLAVDTSSHAPLEGASASGTVETEEIHIVSTDTSCTLDPENRPRAGRLAEACRAGSVETDIPEDLVRTDFQLRFGRLEDAPAQEAPALGTEEAAAPAPAGGSSLLVAAAAASMSAAAAYGLWRLLKWTGLAALLPLYSHIRDDEILDDANRAAIYRLIQQEAGISTKDISERLGLAWGTVTHHLTKLEKRRFVVSKKYGKYRRYFANGQGGTERKDEVAVLRLDRTGDVAALIRQNPGVTQKAVSTALGVSSSTILWHVKRLEQVALVHKVREGKTVRYYPAEGLVHGRDLVTPGTMA